MKIRSITKSRRLLALALLVIGFCSLGLLLSRAALSRVARVASPPDYSAMSVPQMVTGEPADLAAFRQSVGGDLTPVIVELKGEPGVIRKVKAEQRGEMMAMEQIFSYATQLVQEQDSFRASLGQRGVRALMRETDVKQIDGSVRHIQYRFTYLLNGFVAYVATEDIPRLRALPEVAVVSEEEPVQMHLDRAIDYSLGTQTNIADRRAAVYGATQEFQPVGSPGHPETPRTTAIDGFEGQNMIVAVIDSGIDWRHPMFGGTGFGVVNGQPQPTPRPRVSGQPVSADDNTKVIYFYAFSEPVGDPTDDFGHGTLVSSCVAGYGVNSNTPVRNGWGTGRDGTGVGPTLNGAQLFGTAPQARLMAYKVCGPATACAGDIPLAIEDAASPFTLVSSGNPGPVPVAKPVADVINLSLGSTAGDPAAANSRAANNAALSGTIVVASAGNSGPGLGTVGNPGVATLAIGVAASLDPGSVAGSDVLAPGQIPAEPCAANPRPATCDNGTQPAGPPPEKGRSSNLKTPQPGERQGIRIFPVAGGGPLPVESNPGQPGLNTGSVSAHYVFVDRRGNPPPPVPAAVTNRVALVKGSGTFAQIANSVAPLNPAAIVIITNVESATAVQVVSGIPTFTMNENDGDYLLSRLLPGGSAGDPPVGSVSQFPLRLADNVSLPAFQPAMAGFSSRGPARHPNANFRMLKPDVTAPGVGIVGAATIDGIPDETIGLASRTGYTSANGTSFSGPITAGAMALIRQRVRTQLNLDSTDPAQRAVRFDAVTVARALLQNSATNLRNGLGAPQPDGSGSIASINEMGAGHINIADSLTAQAIMVSPTLLLSTPAEYSQPSPSPTPRLVNVPTASYGVIPVVRLNNAVTRLREVIVRDVTNGGGAGTYDLTFQNNRLADSPGFDIAFTSDAAGTMPTTSVNVPAGGQTSFYVRVTANGPQILVDPTEFQWYVTATHASSGKKLRMPFYFRAVTAVAPNSVSPNQLAPTGVENQTAPNCPTDTDGNYTVNWAYTTPAHTGFRVQEATRSQSFFFDDADEPLQPNVIGTTAVTENSRWRDAGIPGTPPTPPMWSSAVNPDTGSLAYFIADAAGQNHSLTMRNPITLPPTGITVTFTTRGSLDANLDFGFLEVSTDNINYFPMLTLTGTITSGTREVDLSAYAGQTVRLRFRLFSPQNANAQPGSGWWVENISINSDDYRTLADLPATPRSLNLTGRPYGTYFYRVAALYANPNTADPNTTIVGPYSNTRCVTVVQAAAPSQLQSVVSRKAHGTAGEFDVALPTTGAPGVEPRTGGANGDHRMIFTFNAPVMSVSSVSASGSSSSPTATGMPGPGPNDYTVNLSGVPNQQYVAVTLNNVQTSTATIAAAQGTMGVLLGDTNRDRSVNSADATQTRNRSGQLTDGTNFTSDVNIDGAVNSGDATIVRRQSGTFISP